MPPRRDLNHDVRILTRAARAGVITLHEAARVLELAPRPATIRLAALTGRGWLRRIRRGVFLVIPPKTPDPAIETARNSGVLAESLFAPCYIGGWSAATRWGLDCARRRAIFIVTAARVKRNLVVAEGFRFHVVHAAAKHIQAPDVTEPSAWGARMSGPARTIVDALAAPQWLGGAIYLAEALVTYRESRNWDEDHFADVLAAVGTGAAKKRLGALLAAKRIDAPDVRSRAAAARTHGVIDLEPGARRKGPIDSYWRVHMNVSLEGWDLPEDDEEDREAVGDDYIEGIDELDP
jgi:predicted transcriptional regulator of viral defense system